MRPVNGLFERLSDRDFLEFAARETTAGKRRRVDVAWLLFRLEDRLRSIWMKLHDSSWRPQKFDLLLVHDPKPRAIARSSIEDRVVHTAIVKLLEPVFLPSMTYDAFACHPGLGTHHARLRLLEFVRRHRFFVHLDIRSYFPSIDLEILRRLLARRIRDGRVLEIHDRVLESGRGIYDSHQVRQFVRMDRDWPLPDRGLPIGAHTSQLFAAQVYLCELDHFVKRKLHVPGYLRYVDDLYLFANTRASLRSAQSAVADYLALERNLRLKSPNARVRSCTGILDGLGARIHRDGIDPRPRSLTRLRAQLRREVYRLPGEQQPDLERSVASRIGNWIQPA